MAENNKILHDSINELHLDTAGLASLPGDGGRETKGILSGAQRYNISHRKSFG